MPWTACRLVLPALAGAIAELEFDGRRMRQAISSSMMATDLADYLVMKGTTFREAHQIVGSLVRLADERSCGLEELPLSDLRAASPAFEDDAAEWLTPLASVNRREAAGGTGPTALRAQIEAAERALQPAVERRRANEVELQSG
jgi:argininosuccinate lyase